MMPHLSLSNISKSFGSDPVLRHVNLSVNRGEFLVVLGQSGSGKTTLLRLVAGFEKLDEGTIALEDRLLSAPRHHVAPEKRNIGIVFQDHALWPHMTIFDNVAFPLLTKKIMARDISERVLKTLKDVSMAWAIHKYPHQLSGGEAQRVALARTLVQDPSLIVFDEPLSSLDAMLRQEIQGMIKELHQHKKFTALYITHDQNEAMRLGYRLAILNKGVVEQCDTPMHLYHHPKNQTVAMLVGHGATLCVDALRESLMPPQGSPVLEAIADGTPSLHNLEGQTSLFVRPEDVTIIPYNDSYEVNLPLVITATVVECYFSHGFYHVEVMLKNTHILQGRSSHPLGMGEKVICEITRYAILSIDFSFMCSGTSAK
jgi:ABC-type sugar transport system ATPase subunit